MAKRFVLVLPAEGLLKVSLLSTSFSTSETVASTDGGTHLRVAFLVHRLFHLLFGRNL